MRLPWDSDRLKWEHQEDIQNIVKTLLGGAAVACLISLFIGVSIGGSGKNEPVPSVSSNQLSPPKEAEQLPSTVEPSPNLDVEPSPVRPEIQQSPQPSSVSSPANKLEESRKSPYDSPEGVLSLYTWSLTNWDFKEMKRLYPRVNIQQRENWLKTNQIVSVQIDGQPTQVESNNNQVVLSATLKSCKKDQSGETDTRKYTFVPEERKEFLLKDGKILKEPKIVWLLKKIEPIPDDQKIQIPAPDCIKD